MERGNEGLSKVTYLWVYHKLMAKTGPNFLYSWGIAEVKWREGGSVPLNFICWNPSPPNLVVFEGEVFGRWLGHEGGALVNEISTFMKRGSTELANLFYPARINGKSMAWKRALTGPRWKSDLGLPSSRIASSTFLLFTSYPVYCILSSSPNTESFRESGTNHTLEIPKTAEGGWQLMKLLL